VLNFCQGGDGEGIGDILDMMDILIQEKEDPEELSKKPSENRFS
jgi:hypothetical protein